MLRHDGICFRSHRTVIKGHVVAGLACSWRWGGGEEIVSSQRLPSKGYLEILGLVFLVKEQQFSALCFPVRPFLLSNFIYWENSCRISRPKSPLLCEPFPNLHVSWLVISSVTKRDFSQIAHWTCMAFHCHYSCICLSQYTLNSLTHNFRLTLYLHHKVDHIHTTGYQTWDLLSAG